MTRQVKGAPEWRLQRGGGALRTVSLPGGGFLIATVGRDCWHVARSRVERNMPHYLVLSSGSFRGPLRVGCLAADVSITAIVEAARRRERAGVADA